MRMNEEEKQALLVDPALPVNVEDLDTCPSDFSTESYKTTVDGIMALEFGGASPVKNSPTKKRTST